MRSAQFFITAILASVSASTAYAADEYTPCLDYFTVGKSGCESPPKKKKKKKEVTPVATQPVANTPPPAPKENFKQRVDRYLDEHGKPPREYVEFYLNPTMENALKWVHTYNQIMDRNRKLTYAWGQAEKVYDEAKEQGADVNVLTVEALPDVPDFGVEVEGYSRYKKPEGFDNAPEIVTQQAGLNPFGNTSSQGITLPNGQNIPTPPNMQDMPFAPPAPPIFFDEAGIPSAIPVAVQNNAEFQFPMPKTQKAAFVPNGGSLTAPSSEGKIEISYYFSADCPYCKRFEPGFQRIIQEMGSKVAVTCVDMTPTGMSRANIHGKVDCDWRPPQSNEAQRLGIKKTPSLLVRRGKDRPLERINGFVEPNRLKDYLLSGKAQ